MARANSDESLNPNVDLTKWQKIILVNIDMI